MTSPILRRLALLVVAGLGWLLVQAPGPARAAGGVSGPGSAAVAATSSPAPLWATGALGRLPLPLRDGGEAAVSGEDREEEGRGTPQPNPDALPTPSGTPQRRAAGRRAAVTASAGFEGPTFTDTATFPPDTQGDVGPSQYVVAINGRLRSYAKATGLPDGGLDEAPDAFFAPVMTPATAPVTGTFTSDPHIRYDRLSHRWYIVMIDVPNNFGAVPKPSEHFFPNRFLLAVSDTDTITAATQWRQFWWDEAVGGAPDGQFADYPTLGIDQNALYVGANLFSATHAGPFSGTRAYVVQKSSVQGAGTAHVTRFDTSGTFTPQGVDDRKGTSAVGWFAGVSQGLYGQLNLLKVTNPGSAAPTISTALPVAVPATAAPKTVPHLGNTVEPGGRLDALDDRLYAATLRDGHIWTAHNVGVTGTGVASGAATRDGARWYDVDVSSGAPVLGQAGTVFDTAATNPLSYWIPTVNVNGQGTMAMGGSVAGAAARVNAFFTGRKAQDAAGATDAPTLATASGDAYNPPADTGGAGGRRWGDYSFVSVDPDDDQTMWSIQQYVAGTDLYGTRITRLRAAAPTVTGVTPSSLAHNPAVTHLTLTGTGFFDPGAGFPDRLAVTSDCGATDIAVTAGTATSVNVDLVAPASGTCTFTVVNPDGQQASSAAVVTNRAPVASDDVGSTPRNTPLTAPSVLLNDTDADGDPLTAQPETDPAHGAVTLDGDGTYTYTPNPGYAGPDAFTYTASDGGSTSPPATVALTVAATNQAPVAAGDVGTTPRDTVLHGTSVLANDVDPDGNTLTAQQATGPSHGTLTVAADGTYAYTPADGYAGPDAFTYTASDGALTSAPATVALTVTATNRAPVAHDDTAVTGRDVTLNGASVLVNDTDRDGNALTAQPVADAEHGTVTLAADGTYVYRPSPGYIGPDSFTYRAFDGAAASAPATVAISVTPVNRRPIATDDTAVTVRDTVLSGPSLLAGDTDPDGDTLQAVKVGDPAHGTVAVALDGTYVYRPAAGYTGPDAFTYGATDGALTGTATVRITVLAPVTGNRPPAAGRDTGATTRDVVLRGASVLANDTDPDGDALTAVKASDPRHGRLALAPGGGYVYTPARGYSGPDAFTYRASDGSALSAATVVAITVRRPKTCRVPRTAGLTVTQAKARLKRAGCTGKVVTTRVRTTKGKRSRVLSTVPAAGRTVGAAAKVTLKVRR